MSENIQIGVNETINIVDINPTTISQVIDINISDNRDDVTINVDPDIIQVNISKGLGPTTVVTSINGNTGDVIISKSTLGLSNVDNTSDINKPISTTTQNALDLKAPLASPTFTGTVSGITKSMIGLSNVDNTSDANKQISSATQTALNLKENSANKGAVNGYASLDGSGLVPASQLPSYVDDVIEYANLASFPTMGVTGKIYVALDTNKIYRWSGLTYIEVSPIVGTIWGGISGTLSNQTDLQSALNAKQDSLGYIPIKYLLRSTYALMIADGTPSVTTIYSITNDENKSYVRSTYLWKSNGNREWIATTPDN